MLLGSTALVPWCFPWAGVTPPLDDHGHVRAVWDSSAVRICRKRGMDMRFRFC